MLKRVTYLNLFLTLTFVATSYAQTPINAVATIGQITNVVEIIGGEQVSVNGLMGAGVDPHLYKASESDVRKLSEADIIFYNGINLESKMIHIFEQMGKRITTVAVGEAIPKEFLLDSLNYSGHHDPHIWFDVTLWTNVAERIADALVEYDPENASLYKERLVKYKEDLKELHTYVHDRAFELDGAQRVLVTAHDAFRYFGRAYDFQVVGLQGISTESEAGAKDVIELAEFIVDRKIKAVFIESSVPERNIKAVQEAVRSRGWDVEIGGELFSDAMGDAGTEEGTYIGMVKHNIDIIVDALKIED